MLAFERALAPAPLDAPVTTTHRVISYTCDPVGNRVETIRRVVSTASAETITYQYNAASRLKV